MKTIIAVAISSLIVSGAYAQPTVNKNNKNQVYTNSTIDDTNRKAILEALGANANDVDDVKKETIKNVDKKSTTHVIKQEEITIKPEIVESKVVQQPSKTVVKEIKPPVVAPVIPVVKQDNVVKEVPKTVLPETKKLEPVKKEVPKVDTIASKQETPKVIEKLAMKETVKNIGQDIKTAPLTPLATLPLKEATKEKTLVKAPVEKEVHIPKITLIKKNEETHTLKTEVKHIPKVKKVIVKKATSPTISNEILLTKTEGSISEVPYELKQKIQPHYLNRNEVKSEFTTSQLNNSTLLHFKLTSLISTRLEEEQFKKVDGSFAKAYVVNNDLKNIQQIDITPTDGQLSYTFDFDKKNICKAIFVQYHLKGENDLQNFVTYIDSKGKLSASLDLKCQTIAFNTKDNVDYTEKNNIFGIFMNEVENKDTLKYTIFNNKNGETYVPHNLQSYIIDKNFNYIYNAHLAKRNNMLGSNYETKVNKGLYYVVGQFLEDNNNQSVVTGVEVK